MQGRKGWTEQQDDRLLKIIKKYGMKNWSLISEKLTLGSHNERTGKQCRERWHNHLDPNINKREWTSGDDEVLFDAHRRHGSKWKEISKFLPGRTDNSIKNHFYSTVRRCLRKIGKLSQPQTVITMKSIKPSVLSKIAENTHLTSLILQIGRSKGNNTNNAAIKLEEVTVARIALELARINQQYQESPTSQAEEVQSEKSISSLSDQCKLEDIPMIKEEKLQQPTHTLRSYFQEEQVKQEQQREEFVLETQQQSKERNESHIQLKFCCFSEEKEKEQTAQKKEEKYQKQQKQQDFWIEEQSRNFFSSPSSKNKFPDVKLLAKVSRNSGNSQSPSCNPALQQRIVMSAAARSTWFRQQKMQILFDPRELFSSSFERDHNEPE